MHKLTSWVQWWGIDIDGVQPSEKRSHELDPMKVHKCVRQQLDLETQRESITVEN